MKDRHQKNQPSPDSGAEQRQHRRLDAAALPNLSAFIGRGQAVRLIDISKRGALVESDARLCPGRTVSLRFVTQDTEVTLAGYVVRSSVSGLSDSQLIYRTALNFGQDNQLCERLLAEEGAGTTETKAAPEDTGAQEPPILELVASVHQSAKELTAMLSSAER